MEVKFISNTGLGFYPIGGYFKDHNLSFLSNPSEAKTYKSSFQKIYLAGLSSWYPNTIFYPDLISYALTVLSAKAANITLISLFQLIDNTL